MAVRNQIDYRVDIVPNSVVFGGNVVAVVFVMPLIDPGPVSGYLDIGGRVFDKDLSLDYNPVDMDSVNWPYIAAI